MINMNKRSSGQTFSEFALLLALVVIVALGGLIAFSGSLKTALASLPFVSGMSSGSSGSGGAGGSASSGAVAAAGVKPGDSYYTMSDGTVVDLGSYNGNIQESIETSGVNGTTDMLASTIQAMAKSLVDQGKLTPGQSNLLIDLANKGHNVAATEKLIETLIATPVATPASLQSTMVTYNGVQYANVWSVAMGQLGMCSGTQCVAPADAYGGMAGAPTLTLSAYDNNYWGQNTSDFLQTYQAVQASGILSDPSVNSFVSQLVSNVANIADNFEFNVLTTTDAGYTADNSQISNFNQNNASAITNLNGVQICTVGTGTDTGTHCTAY